MNITLVYASAPRLVHEQSLTIPEGCTVAQALGIAGWLERFPQIKDQHMALGLWGHKATPTSLLREGDRLEVYRVLRVDPKVARRERFVGQGARGTGLFARRRPGSKAGY